MDSSNSPQSIDQVVGYMPGIPIRPADAWRLPQKVVRCVQKHPFIPFGGLILGFHEALFSKPDDVHDFVTKHYTAALRRTTIGRSLYVQGFPITGWAALHQLGRKGLIVDSTVRQKLHKLVRSLPLTFQAIEKGHLLERSWYFYTLTLEDRQKMSVYIGPPGSASKDSAMEEAASD